MREFFADFNRVDGDRLSASLRRQPNATRPDMGELVVVRDREGNRCNAIVAGIDEKIIRFEVDMRSFVSVGVEDAADAHLDAPQPVPRVRIQTIMISGTPQSGTAGLGIPTEAWNGSNLDSLVPVHVPA